MSYCPIALQFYTEMHRNRRIPMYGEYGSCCQIGTIVTDIGFG